MNKELFVSSTPHETKVGLVEDDLLAEVYLERENEYTLAGSIYKGRVTRVLPGMQSAFVDVGLERDAFLYVSDFMELEEHDDDLTDIIPANRSVQDMRPQAAGEAAPEAIEGSEAVAESEADLLPDSEQGFVEAEGPSDAQLTASATGVPERSGDSQNRERGGFRGRRRRRGGRRDGRSDGRDRGSDRGFDRSSERTPERTSDRVLDRGSEQRFSRPSEAASSRSMDSERSQSSGPPPGYQPILLPGESISKYQRFAQQPAAQEAPRRLAVTELAADAPVENAAPLSATFPEDEPIFAAAAAESIAEPLHEEHEDIRTISEEHAESASTSADWNQEFRRPEAASLPDLGWPGETIVKVEEEAAREEQSDPVAAVDEASGRSQRDEIPAFAAPGTMEEETIDE